MPIAVGQVSKGRSASSASQATTAVNTQAAGSTIVLGLTWANTAAFSSVVDSKGNTYTQIGSEIAYSGALARWYYCENAVGGASHTATLNLSGAAGVTVLFLEITGGVLSGILDQAGSRTDAATPFTLAAGLTTAQANELLLAGFSGDSGSNPATHAESGLGGGSIQIEETDGTQFWTSAFAARIVTATGSFNPSWTESGASASAVALVTFKELADSGVSLAWVRG
jgi:hypothetical protein